MEKSMWSKEKCIVCDSINHIRESDEDEGVFAYECWNCKSVWLLETHTSFPITILNGQPQRD